jgi:putative oxidoreductase
MHSLSKSEQISSWVCRVMLIIILLPALLLKLTGAEDSTYVFSKIGVEPWARYGSAIAELIAVVSLLTLRFVWAGALITLVVITGAIVSHLTILGLVVQKDGGGHFALAVVVFLCSAVTVYLHRQIPHPSWHRCHNPK